MSVSQPTATATPTATPTPIPVDVEKIAYTYMEQGKPSLWTMNPDGTSRTRITKVGASCYFPLWSPNGKSLAFLSDMVDGKLNLFLINKGSTEFKPLTSFPDMTLIGNQLKPPLSWSPRSDEISFIYRKQVWKIQTDGAGLVSLFTPDPNFSISALEWAPHRDTKYVAFLLQQGVNYFSLMLVNPRLLDNLDLADLRNAVEDISWSPDARNVAYLVKRIANDSVFTASPESSQPKSVIQWPKDTLAPLISYCPIESAAPTLMTLAKKSEDDTGYRVAIVDKAAKDETDTGSLKFLTDPGVDNAIWSPDGSKIAYGKDGELWIMDALTGNNKTRIAATGIMSPCWSKK